MSSPFEKIKKLDFKKTSRFVIIIFFIGAMVFGTITNLGFKSFDFLTWLADMMILLGIQVFGLIFGELIGKDKAHEELGGLFQRDLSSYNNLIATNKDVIYRGFAQWYSKKLPEELFAKKRDFLTNKGIDYDNAIVIVKYLDINLVDKLATEDIFIEQKDKEPIYIGKIKDYQVEAVKYVLGGDFHLDAPNSSYYLSAHDNDKHSGLSIFELGNAYGRDIKHMKTFNRAIKLASSTIISAFMAALTVYELMGGDDLGAWMKLLNRITALFTSLFSGYLSARATVKVEAFMLENKIASIGMFLADVKDKVFVIKTHEEIVKEKYEEHKRKEKEARDSVVEPEVIMLDNNSSKLPLHKKVV